MNNTFGASHSNRETTKSHTGRHLFEGQGERCDLCNKKRGFFLHNAPNSGKDWAKGQ